MCKKQKNSSENILSEKSKKEKGNCKEDSSNLELQSSTNESEENIKSIDEIQNINKEVSITNISETQEFTYNPITVVLQKTLSANLSIQMEIYQKLFQKEVMSCKENLYKHLKSYQMKIGFFFRAISYAITGPQHHHHEIRKKKHANIWLKLKGSYHH